MITNKVKRLRRIQVNFQCRQHRHPQYQQLQRRRHQTMQLIVTNKILSNKIKTNFSIYVLYLKQFAFSFLLKNKQMNFSIRFETNVIFYCEFLIKWLQSILVGGFFDQFLESLVG